MLDRTNYQKVLASAFGALVFTFASVALAVSPAATVQGASARGNTAQMNV